MIDRMKLKLTRDEARCIQQHFLPYMIQVCQMKCRADQSNEDALLLAKVVRCTMYDIGRMFDRRLNGFGKKFVFNFREAEGIILYKMMLAFPVKAEEFWHQIIRNSVIDILCKQIKTYSDSYGTN